MSVRSQEIGQSNEAKLLYELLKEIKRLQSITGNLSVTISPGDVEIGAVELKDALLDVRAKIVAANAAKAATDNTLLVQQLALDGTVPPSGSTHSNAPFSKITDGTSDLTLGTGTTKTVPTELNDGTTKIVFGTGTVKNVPVGINDGTTQVDVIPTIKSLKEDISSIGGEAVVADNGAGVGVTKVVPVGGKYNATAQVYSDGDVAMIQADPNGNVKVNIAVSPTNSHDQVTHYTPVHGIATYTSAQTITLTGFPIVPDITNCKVVSLSVIPLAGTTVVRYENGINGYYIGCSSGVVTIYLNGVAINAFLVTDLKYEVRLCLYPFAQDVTNDVVKVSEQSPCNRYYTGPESLLAAAQTLTASMADFGYEVPCSGSATVGIWIKLTINQATNVQVQILAKHTSAGTEEYYLPIQAISTGLISVTPEVVQFPNASGLYLLQVSVNNVIPFIQIQMKETDNGTDATVDTLYITKGY